ncbi:uridine phosphorylase [Nonlabens dokdonensis]|jgi:uridine phosphorylase|uniref:Uridine phosphorylase n=2 Tax=Nonlabens dokdonensis TaxID=328515 RepID=L7WDS7_NONDD|nr:nucleoside phosphorylase [Nonlabens dokdonensis]AGC78407.1 purine nucleoside phosphorylase [Nonlabens dokdonensis DSW-6]PZX38155.1 uridine phosphorylase [Nonlabens dokdonensis]
MPIANSELIINPDGSIYHLNLKPYQLAQTIITVGDPERVKEISKHFDVIELKVGKREFHTHTGIYKNKRISVISTGIGTDNIDIVFNELDALVNVDFNTREVKKELTQLDIVRVGTSGAVQSDIPVDSFLLSQRGIGFDSLMHWYDSDGGDLAFAKAVSQQIKRSNVHAAPYVVSCNKDLAKKFQTIEMQNGNTITNVGFYGPQSRKIRLEPAEKDLNSQIADFNYEGSKITNLEMETAGIYAMASLLGHRAVSLNAILANRATGEFSDKPKDTVEKLIKFTLDCLVA